MLGNAEGLATNCAQSCENLSFYCILTLLQNVNKAQVDLCFFFVFFISNSILLLFFINIFCLIFYYFYFLWY